MYWSLPLTAISGIVGFNNTPIIKGTHSHVQYVTDEGSEVWPWLQYKTSPHTPPHMNISVNRKEELAPGYVFLDPSDINEADGTEELSGTGFIMTTDGDLVFAGLETGMGFCQYWTAGMTDFRKQRYNGKSYLTYWNGCNTRKSHWGHRWGRVTFIDEEYTNFTLNPNLGVNMLDPAPKGQIDVHEHQMTDRNTMLVTSYNNSQVNLTALDGPEDGWVADSMFFEVDIETQNVLFEWRAMDHIPLKKHNMGWHHAGNASEKVPWDWFHINSVQLVGENYLISARHHWSLYLLSKNGSVIWELNGVDGGDFGSIPSPFHWQHHARAWNVSEEGMAVSLFNNKVNGAKEEAFQTEGIAYYLPMPASNSTPPRLLKRLQTNDEPLYSGTQGSYTFDLGNGNGFIGYGLLPIAREYGKAWDGSELLWQAQFGEPKSVQSYRVYKDTWHGTPKHWDPVAKIEQVRSKKPKVYVSWNGATDIEGWAVYAGPSPDKLESMGVVEKKGFETVLDLPGSRSNLCVQLGAIRDGAIIRASNVDCIGEWSTIWGIEAIQGGG